MARGSPSSDVFIRRAGLNFSFTALTTDTSQNSEFTATLPLNTAPSPPLDMLYNLYYRQTGHQ